MYQSPSDRLEFVIATVKQSKTDLVAEEGIGETVPLTLFGWKDDVIEVVAQSERVLDRNEQRRFEAMTGAAFAIRKGWGVTSFSIASEGYRSPVEGGPATPQELASRFASGDQAVEEIIITCHIEPFGAVLTTTPFTYAIGRKVVFGETHDEPVARSAYVSSLQTALTIEPTLDQEFDIPGVSLWF